MLNFFEPIRNNEYDYIMFTPHKKDHIKIELGSLEDPGEKKEGSKLGDFYEIFIFRKDKKGNPIDLDHFRAILVCPMEYTSGLISSGWYGLISRWTSTSEEPLKEYMEHIKSLCA